MIPSSNKTVSLCGIVQQKCTPENVFKTVWFVCKLTNDAMQWFPETKQIVAIVH